jgi:ArsR family transcriptional regulator
LTRCILHCIEKQRFIELLTAKGSVAVGRGRRLWVAVALEERDAMWELLRVVKALGDRNRLRVLKMLEIRKMCVREITEVLGIAQSAVSRHLRLLQEAGLVESKRAGLWVHYHLATARMNKYAPILLAHVREWVGQDSIVKRDQERVARLFPCHLREGLLT